MDIFGITTASKKQVRRRRSQLSRMPICLPFVALLAYFAPTIVTALSINRNSKLSIKSTKLWATDVDPSNGVTCSDQDNWIRTAIEGAAATAATPNDNTFSRDIQTRFFLVNTKHPGNVGSSARSIKTMGFFPEGLVVVDPHDKRVLGRKKCIDASSGATDVLEQTLLVVDDDEHERNESKSSSLQYALREAFGGENILVCGTGMPVDMSHARASRSYLEPRKFFERLLGEYQQQTEGTTNKPILNIAFVFGNERFGMAPEDLNLCDVVLGIPTNPSFGSLNLATAVQIIAYDWRQALGGYEDVE